LTASGTSIPSLTSVSCPSRFFCMAVGNVSFHQSAPLSAKWTP
jgi:hypothetical protein